MFFPRNDAARYDIPAATTIHVIAGLEPRTSYKIDVTPGGGSLAVAVTRGAGGTMTSGPGVLRFATSADGSLAP